jgi:hypothetical protein
VFLVKAYKSTAYGRIHVEPSTSARILPVIPTYGSTDTTRLPAKWGLDGAHESVSDRYLRSCTVGFAHRTTGPCHAGATWSDRRYTKWHVNQIFGKLQVHNRTTAIAKARNLNFTSHGWPAHTLLAAAFAARRKIPYNEEIGMISGKTTLIAHVGYPTEAFKARLSTTRGSTRPASTPS